MLLKSARPVILADVEIARYGLQKRLSALLSASGIPYATLMMGKCIVDEENPQNVGLYMGQHSRDYVRSRVEEADVVLQLGVFLTDLNSGGFSMQLDQRRVISATHHQVKISSATYHNVFLGDFIESLTKRFSSPRGEEDNFEPASRHAFHNRSMPWKPGFGTKLSLNRFFDRMASFIPANSIVIAETGNALFGTAETLMPKGVSFLSQVFYGSIGYTLPAALGASLVRARQPEGSHEFLRFVQAAPHRKVILFIGDGSFQVTGQELSSLIRHGCDVTIFLINNKGYTIERVIVDGEYNDIANWNYGSLIKVFGGEGNTVAIRTEEELESGLGLTSPGTSLLEILVEKDDCVATMRKAAVSMRKRLKEGLPKGVELPSLLQQQ